jgi:hypothetical protein
MSMSLLPDEFRDLDDLVEEWAIPTSNARAEKRLQSTMERLTEFYKRMTPRAAHSLAYLQTVGLEGLSASNANLLRLLLTLAEVSPAIEWYGRPDGAIGLDSRRFKLVLELGQV